VHTIVFPYILTCVNLAVVLFLHHTIPFLYLSSYFFTYHPISLPTILFLCCTVLVLHHILSLPIILFLYLPSSFFAVLSLFYTIIFLYLSSSFCIYHPFSLLYCPWPTPSTFFTYHPLSRPTILFLCCSVLILHHTVLFLHCTVCSVHTTVFFRRGKRSKGLQKIFSDNTSLLVALQSLL